jgi:secondary thiamine-phosphate synthase enzyme
MRQYTEHLTIQTKQPRELVKITPQAKDAVKKSELTEGMVFVASLHSNSAVFVSIAHDEFREDLETWLGTLAPARENYKLGRKYESNASTLLQGLLLNTQAMIGLSEGRLELGPWQEVFYYEFDGNRPKRVLIKVLGD